MYANVIACRLVRELEKKCNVIGKQIKKLKKG